LYRLEFTGPALADVKALPKNTRNSLKKALAQQLARYPESCSGELEEPLAGFRSFHWRRHRVVFKLFADRELIAIVGVGERSPQSVANIYRRLEELAARGKLAEAVLAVLRQR